MSLMATLDVMNGVIEITEAREQLVELLVNVGIAINTEESEELDASHFEALANAYRQFTTEEESWIGGSKALKLYVKAYKKEFNAVFGMEPYCDDEDIWNDIDFERISLPKNLILRIAGACGRKSANDTKSWYEYCEARREEG